MGQQWLPLRGEPYQGRLAESRPLDFLEKHLFRTPEKVMVEKQQTVYIRESLNPAQEMEETAGMIRSLVRTQGYRYRDFAVITGDMEVYAPAAARAFEKYHIPCFLDQNTRSL